MHSIFYDLESTDMNPIGQILNYCFIEVDDNFAPVAELSGKIKISRLQLPSPGAILANRTDVIAHQKENPDSERDAAKKIMAFIQGTISKHRAKVPLIGFNSSKFDLLHLRTTLIRNGFNCYFGGNLIYKDVLHVARKLSCTRSDFPRTAHPKRGMPDKVSLSLEHLTHEFKLLTGEQLHESKFDVELTIKLADLLKRQFGIDVRTYEAYEAGELHRSVRTGEVYNQLVPNYDRSAETLAVELPMTLLDVNHRYALWIDLESYRKGEGARSVRWFSPQTYSFCTDGRKSSDRVVQELADRALKELSTINLSNFFKKSICDIEQDIYRLDIDAIGALHAAIWENNQEPRKQRKNSDLNELYLRNRLAHYEWGGVQDELVRGHLKSYALNRYGGQANIRKSNLEERYEDGVYSENFHTTYRELLEEIAEREKSGSPEDLALLASLTEFYKSSDIVSVAGPELSKIVRIKKSASSDSTAESPHRKGKLVELIDPTGSGSR